MSTARTSINIDKKILKKARSVAKNRQTTLKQIFEEALVLYLNNAAAPAPRNTTIQLVTLKGKTLAGVDLDDRDNLYQNMEKGP